MCGFLCGTSPLTAPAATDGPADLVLTNGAILTVDPRDSVAEAVAIRADRILKVGTNTAIRSLVGPQTQVIDLQGRAVTPGIIDSHLHVLYYGRQSWPGYVDIRFPRVRSMDDLLRAVGEKARQLPKGAWIAGNQGFHLPDDAALTRTALDTVAPDNPVYLRHSSGQSAVVNSRALELAGIRRNTPNPFGGRIVHDPRTGEPNGVLLHYPAENLIGRLAPGYGERTDAELEDDVRRGQQLCLEAGITSAQDVIVGSLRDVQAYQRLAARNELKMRVYILFYVQSEEQAAKLVRNIPDLHSDMLTFAGWKLAIDGGLAAGTAMMYDRNLFAARNAYAYHETASLKQIVLLLHKTGMQVAFHVVGDRGLDQALDAIEDAQRESPRKDPRHRIEHALFIKPESRARIRKLGVVISTQPQWISWHADGFRRATDDKNMATFLPLHSLLQDGVPLAFGCDVPAALAHEPKWAFLGAVGRRTASGYVPNADERLTVRETLRIHTMGSAYAALEENLKGSIEPGKLADLVVWSHNLYTMASRDIRDLTAEMTIVGGKIVFRR